MKNRKKEMGKIYTKKGDKGTTGTIMGRLSKADRLTETLGTIDELNSWIGVIRGKISNDVRFVKIGKELVRIQNNLMIIASGLAGSKLKLGGGETRKLEKLIDKLTSDLPELKNFIFPVGEIQLARAVARRAEREVVRLTESPDFIKTAVNTATLKKYLNRLSDTLFTIGRWVNWTLGIKEEVWRV